MALEAARLVGKSRLHSGVFVVFKVNAIVIKGEPNCDDGSESTLVSRSIIQS